MSDITNPEIGLSVARSDSGRVKRRSVTSWLRYAANEPFFQFILLGMLIWAAVEYIQAHNQRYIIDIGPAQEQRLAIAYQQQFQQAPTKQQLASLVDHYVREEIYLREGLALNLDREDEIVRRRIAQKFEFLQTDLAVPEQPWPGVLEKWFENHKTQYLNPKAISFTQVFVSPDKGGDDAARARAAGLLTKLQSGAVSQAAELGDAFPGPTDFTRLIPAEANRVFGESEFSDKIFSVPQGRWAGPFRSGYGWHLVYITDIQPESTPSLDAVRSRALADWMEERRQELNTVTFEKLEAKYTIRRGTP